MKSLLTVCLVFLAVLGCKKRDADEPVVECTIPNQTVKEGQEECTCPEGQEVADGKCVTYTLGIPTTTESSQESPQEKGSLADATSAGKPLVCGPPQNTPYGYMTIILDKKWKNRYKVHIGAIVSLKQVPGSDKLYTQRSDSPGPRDEPGACFYIIQADASSRYMVRVEEHSDSTGIRSTIDQSQKSVRKLQPGTHVVSLVRENDAVRYAIKRVQSKEDRDDVANFKHNCCLEIKLLSPSKIKILPTQ